ncbi:MAG: efflux RND transporter periplasmic adaptor subunit [Fimbriimonadaceae bacterium]
MKQGIFGFVLVAILGVGVWAIFIRGRDGDDEIQYRFAAVTQGELVRSISATGQVVALTSVDIRSKAGGTVVRLAVDEGSEVRAGDLIAEIDPRDTRAVYDQASADVQTAQARARQAEVNLELQRANSETAVAEAEAALQAARIRLERAELEASRQPTLTQTSIETARANLASAEEDLRRYETVTAPQVRRDAEGAHNRAKTDLATAEAELKRQEELLRMGYVSRAAFERAQASLASASAAYSTATQRMSTLDREISAELQTRRLARDRAASALRQAEANASQDEIAQKNLADARQAVRSAEINLRQARDAARQNAIRQSEFVAAQAGTVRSKVQMENARVQLESTTVLSPRDGVVTRKYIEEGTVIPPGTSTFAQGTSIVQISDVTRLFVECAVDESDVAQVRVGQPVRIITEAFPGVVLAGRVDRVNPAAQTEQNITAVKVRVEVLPGYSVKVLPGMTATCEFITFNKENVVIVPSQAIRNEGGETFVLIKPTDPKAKPTRRVVKTGDRGNDGVEVVEGLKVGEEVVVAEINLRELRELERRMAEAQQGGGLAGGRPAGGGRPGGGRPGGGGGR